MDRTTRHLGADLISPTSATGRDCPRASGGRSGRVDADRLAFAMFSAALLEELAPRGLLETIHADRAILAAWQLREAVEAERVGVLEGIGADSSDLLDFGRLERDLRRQSDRAARALARALDDLASIRRLGWGQATPLDTTVSDLDEVAIPDDDAVAAIDEGLPRPGDSDDDLAPEPESAEDEAALPRWSDRLVFDPNVSDDSPVVRGTWVTVSQVVSRIVDGYTWADILRTHPELNEDDLRACLAFAHEQETDEGRSAYRF